MDEIIADALIFSGKFDSAKQLLDSMARSENYQTESFLRHVLINQVELALQKQSFGEIDSLYDALADERYDLTAHDYLNLAEAALLSGRHKDAGF